MASVEMASNHDDELQAEGAMKFGKMLSSLARLAKVGEELASKIESEERLKKAADTSVEKTTADLEEAKRTQQAGLEKTAVNERERIRPRSCACPCEGRRRLVESQRCGQ